MYGNYVKCYDLNGFLTMNCAINLLFIHDTHETDLKSGMVTCVIRVTFCEIMQADLMHSLKGQFACIVYASETI